MTAGGPDGVRLARGQAALQRPPVHDDRRPLRLHHPAAVVRPRSGVEARPAGAGGDRARAARPRSRHRHRRSRAGGRGARGGGRRPRSRAAHDPAGAAPSRAPAPVRFLVGDMTSLPLPPASVDVVTTGYGLRNVPDLDRAIAEIARVLRPGGRFLSLDFEKPAHAGWRRAYFAYLTVVGATVGTLLHGDPDTYRYIPASLARYPGADGRRRAPARRRLRVRARSCRRWPASWRSTSRREGESVARSMLRAQLPRTSQNLASLLGASSEHRSEHGMNLPHARRGGNQEAAAADHRNGQTRGGGPPRRARQRAAGLRRVPREPRRAGAAPGRVGAQGGRARVPGADAGRHGAPAVGSRAATTTSRSCSTAPGRRRRSSAVRASSAARSCRPPSSPSARRRPSCQT